MGNGQDELDGETTARAIARSEPAAEQRRVLRGDREPQAAAAATRRIRHEEALEDSIQPVGRNAWSAVGDLDGDGVAVRAEPNDDDRAGGVLAGVVEEIAEDPLETPWVGVDHDPI